MWLCTSSADDARGNEGSDFEADRQTESTEEAVEESSLEVVTSAVCVEHALNFVCWTVERKTSVGDGKRPILSTFDYEQLGVV